ncbi:hypothetical protein BD414DRAFT_506770 [Trametes punicea]|nr:hypothetical protein BD414DRAFT_506770 [Trametes punicea]
MLSVARSIVLTLTVLVTQTAASASARGSTAFLSPFHVWPLSHNGVNSTSIAARSDGCPSGWTLCSALTCYPLDGSECCSDGDFCEVGTYCDLGGCCLNGEICVGNAGPPITIGGGDEPTGTDTYVPTTTHHTTTTRPATTHSSTSRSTIVTYDPDTTDFDTATAPLTDAHGTEPTAAATAQATTSLGTIGLPPPTSDVPQLPFSGSMKAAPLAGKEWASVVLAGLIVLTSIGRRSL